MSDFKPMLACDADLKNLDKLPYPMGMFLKYDGVRVIHRNGFYGRSMKLHRNPHLQSVFNKPEYFGFDSEGLVGAENAPNACTVTSGAFSRKKDKPKEGKFVRVDATCYVFDDFANPYSEYEKRYYNGAERVMRLLRDDPTTPLRVAPMVIVKNVDDLLEYEDKSLNDGHEGLILRDLRAEYKFGRCTAKEGSYLRIKRFEDREGIIIGFEEGFKNTNEAKKDPLGRTERSTAKEGMIPNGQIAAFLMRDLVSDEVVKVSSGKLTEAEAIEGFNNFEKIFLNKIGKYKVFAKGTGNFTKPRFPTYQSLRSPEDMS